MIQNQGLQQTRRRHSAQCHNKEVLRMSKLGSIPQGSGNMTLIAKHPMIPPAQYPLHTGLFHFVPSYSPSLPPALSIHKWH
jgi:hypothetical protein